MLGFKCFFFRGSQRRLQEWHSLRTSQYKTYVHSLSFGVSFALIGVLQWSHGRSKSASRLLGHPVSSKIAVRQHSFKAILFGHIFLEPLCFERSSIHHKSITLRSSCT